jgi:proteasome lid subunit RPN8/RPN11
MKSEDSQVKSGSLFSERTGNAPPAQLVRLTPAVYAAILAHGEETYPDECCGALLGHFSPEGWRIEAAVRAGNARADSAHNRYQIAPDDLVKIEREARRMHLEIAGFYHSHPDHPAHWSPTDLEEAHWLGCCHVITRVVQGKATETNAFLLNGLSEEDKRFEAQTIQVDDERIGPDRK